MSQSGWRFRSGRWVSVPRTPDLASPWENRRRELQAMLETAEDVELYAAELGITRREAHR